MHKRSQKTQGMLFPEMVEEHPLPNILASYFIHGSPEERKYAMETFLERGSDVESIKALIRDIRDVTANQIKKSCQNVAKAWKAHQRKKNRTKRKEDQVSDYMFTSNADTH